MPTRGLPGCEPTHFLFARPCSDLYFPPSQTAQVVRRLLADAVVGEDLVGGVEDFLAVEDDRLARPGRRS